MRVLWQNVRVGVGEFMCCLKARVYKKNLLLSYRSCGDVGVEPVLPTDKDLFLSASSSSALLPTVNVRALPPLLLPSSISEEEVDVVGLSVFDLGLSLELLSLSSFLLVVVPLREKRAVSDQNLLLL